MPRKRVILKSLVFYLNLILHFDDVIIILYFIIFIIYLLYILVFIFSKTMEYPVQHNLNVTGMLFYNC